MDTMRTPTPPFAVTPRTPGDPVADLLGFELVHRALVAGTRQLAAAVTDVARRGICPAERVDAIRWFARGVLHEVHVHHAREDAVLWPVVLASSAGAVDLAPLVTDHAAIEDLLPGQHDRLGRFVADRFDHVRPFADELGALAQLVAEHIAIEEALVFPVIREHVSAADFAHCERLFQQGTSLGHLRFVMPWIISRCDGAERDRVLGEAPRAFRAVLRLVERGFQRRHALVVGT